MFCGSPYHPVEIGQAAVACCALYPLCRHWLSKLYHHIRG